MAYTYGKHVYYNLWVVDLLVADGHNMVPGDFEDPRRREGRIAPLLLELGHFVCCTIEHYLRVDV